MVVPAKEAICENMTIHLTYLFISMQQNLNLNYLNKQIIIILRSSATLK